MSEPIICEIDGGDMDGWLTVRIDPQHVKGRCLGERVGIIFDLPEPQPDPLASHPELPLS